MSLPALDYTGANSALGGTHALRNFLLAADQSMSPTKQKMHPMQFANLMQAAKALSK